MFAAGAALPLGDTLAVKLANAWGHPGFFSGDDVEVLVAEQLLHVPQVRLAAEEFARGEPFLLINSDNYYPAQALAALRLQGPPSLLGFDRHGLVRGGNIDPERIAKFALKFGLGQPPEHRFRSRASCGRQRRPVDERADLRQAAVVVVPVPGSGLAAFWAGSGERTTISNSRNVGGRFCVDTTNMFFSLAPTVTCVRCLMMRSSITRPAWISPMRSTLGPLAATARIIAVICPGCAPGAPGP